MVKVAYRYLLIILGALSIFVGIIGIFLPIIPGIPFFILALGCFDRSSPTFHRALLNLPYIGPRLHAWEKHRKITKQRKKQLYLIVLTTFFISLTSLVTFTPHMGIFLSLSTLQLILIAIMVIILFFISRIDEM